RSECRRLSRCLANGDSQQRDRDTRDHANRRVCAARSCRLSRPCGRHFGATSIATSPLSPPRGTTTTPFTNATRKLMSTFLDGSKKPSISASSSGSTRRILGPGGSDEIEKCPCESSVKLPTNSCVTGSNATTCAPKSGVPFLVTRPEMLPRCDESLDG